jgi:glycosyltransferase involved in cell wall biosynthesis
MGTITTTKDQRWGTERHEDVALGREAKTNASSSAEISTRIAIIVSHPIQYFVPYYRALAATSGVVLKVFFCSRMGAETYYDRDFNTRVKWDIPLLEGYESEFLDSPKEIKSPSFWKIDNPGVGAALKRFHPDVVEVNGYSHRTSWRAVSWCNRQGVPAVLYSDSNATATPAMWKRALKAIIVRHFYRHLDGALASGDNNRAYHLHYGIPKERVFARAMPLDYTRLVNSVGDKAATRLEVRKQLGIPEGAFVVVYAGKLSPVKCPSHLLEAVQRCAQRGMRVWALFVGEGALRLKLEAFIAKHEMKSVVLAGFINQSAIGRYFAASDVLTLMSSYEPKGQTVPEAGSLGCPAILSDRIGCIGPNDCARPGENALVYPWSDIDAFANCIARLYKDEQLYRSMSEAAVRIASLQDASVAAAQMKEAAAQLKRIGCRR